MNQTIVIKKNSNKGIVRIRVIRLINNAAKKKIDISSNIIKPMKLNLENVKPFDKELTPLKILISANLDVINEEEVDIMNELAKFFGFLI